MEIELPGNKSIKINLWLLPGDFNQYKNTLIHYKMYKITQQAGNKNTFIKLVDAQLETAILTYEEVCPVLQ